MVLTALLIFSPPAKATEWYEAVQFIDNDPFQFDIQRGVLFPSAGVTLAGHVASGKMYAVLPSATVNRLQSSPNHILVLDTHVLTAAEAASYRQIFHRAASATQVPWIVGAIGAIPTEVTAFVSITSTLLDGLQRSSAANQKISAAGLEQLMAASGRFELALLLLHDPSVPSHQYVSTTVIYRVMVGNETRSYAICSTTFALKVV